eukprot:TRINITY_DN812_c0_g1_i25.p1 TRINITY_DN812_c0_g1~~TRINITY_DN812_c0_g1_i25.p1  ORF type:complete len:697 (+),score=266.54 TRINITY_DN812_c0_g1_i25:139-2229(+)
MCIRDSLNTYINKGLASPTSRVRAAAVTAVSYLSEFLMPDILLFHKIIIPALLANFRDLDTELSQRAIFAVDLFCDNLDEQVVEYLPLLVPQLLLILEDNNSTISIRRLCISALGSCISSSQAAIINFVEEIYKRLVQLLQIRDVAYLGVRAQATQELGKIASALKTRQDLLQALIIPIVEPVYDGLRNIDDFEIREASFTFFYHLASACGNEMAPLLGQLNLCQFALDCALSSSGIEKKKKEEFSLDSDSEDEFAPGNSAGVKMPFLDEKSAAIHALGEFAKECPQGFAPYFEKTVIAMQELHNYFYENVRNQVSVCLKHLVEFLVKFTGNGTIPTYQKGLPCVQRLNPKVEEFVKIELLSIYFHHIENDESADVVSGVIECIKELVTLLGPAFIDTSLEQIVSSVNLLLKGSTSCQAVEEDEEDFETNYMLFEHVNDLLMELARVLLDGYTPTFNLIYPNLCSYARPDKDPEDIIIAFGTLAEVCAYCPTFVQGNYGQVLELVFATQEIGDDEINRNACFCIGNLAENGRELIHPLYNKIFLYLKHVIESASLLEARENAISAFCKMGYTSPDKVPLQEVIPTIFKFVPFKGDVLEIATLVKFFIFILQQNAALIKDYFDTVMAIFIDAVINHGTYGFTNELYTTTLGVLKNLVNADEGVHKVVEALVLKLSEAERTKFMAVFQQTVCQSQQNK